jgi:hypothetical protein
VTVIVARVEDAEAGEATLIDKVDERLDETQPLDAIDETLKITQPLPTIVAKKNEASGPAGKRADGRPASSSVLKWVLILALAGSAVGAWAYWNHQQAIARESHSR